MKIPDEKKKRPEERLDSTIRSMVRERERAREREDGEEEREDTKWAIEESELRRLETIDLVYPPVIRRERV